MLNLVDVSRGEHVRLFNTIAIETGAKCNRACGFCPVHGYTREDEYMPDDMIAGVLADLKSLNYSGRVTNYIYNEPIRDKRCLDIITSMRIMLPRACLMSSTNGDYFRSKEDISKLFDAGLNQLCINVYSASDDAHDTNRERYDRGVVLAQTRYDLLKSWVTELGLDQKRSVYTKASPRSRICSVQAKFGLTPASKKLDVFELQNRSGNVPWFKPALEEPLVAGCTRPFRFLNINWRGDAVICCNDYHGVTAMGNVRDKSLTEIWNSPGFNEYRLHLQNKDRHIKLCDKCDYRGGQYGHMIDNVTGIVT